MAESSEPGGDGPDASVEVAADAAEFLGERGGVLYLWVSEAGLLEAKNIAPSHNERWSWHTTNGVRIAIGESASEPTKWAVQLRHIPWKHLDITSNLTIGTRMINVPGGG